MQKLVRAEIFIRGYVQGVGFRYFVYSKAKNFSIQGEVKNLYTGEVLVIAEGVKEEIESFIEIIKQGPSRSNVTSCKIDWKDYTNSFINFEITH